MSERLYYWLISPICHVGFTLGNGLADAFENYRLHYYRRHIRRRGGLYP